MLLPVTILIIFLSNNSPMSPVEFKKRSYPSVEFKGKDSRAPILAEHIVYYLILQHGRVKTIVVLNTIEYHNLPMFAAFYHTLKCS